MQCHTTNSLTVRFTPVDKSSISMAALTVADIAELLNSFNQDGNGEDVYSNDKALYGFVPENRYMLIPSAIHDMFDVAGDSTGVGCGLPALDFDDLQDKNAIADILGVDQTAYKDAHPYFRAVPDVETTKMLVMNYLHLTDGGMSEIDAFVIAASRVRSVQLGFYQPQELQANLIFNETTVVDDAHAIYGDLNQCANIAELLAGFGPVLQTVFAHMANENYGHRFVVKMLDAFWFLVFFFFFTRGHHAKDDFMELAVKILTANFEGALELPREIDLITILHTFSHPFGVRCLAVYSFHLAIWGKLGQALLLRFTSSPNGTAVITTTAAAVNALATEAWYGKFKEAFGEQIDFALAAAKKINQARFSYHQAARLWGVTVESTITIAKKTYPIDEVKSMVAPVATAAEGFLSAMRAAKQTQKIQSFSFENAKAMQKMAKMNPLAALKVRELILLSLTLITEAETVEEAADAVFPVLKDTKNDDEENKSRK